MNRIRPARDRDNFLSLLFVLALGVTLVTAFVLQGCTITHMSKTADGVFEASNYSLGMDRKDLKVDINKRGEDVHTVIGVGASNASESMGKVQAGMATMLEGFMEMNR